MKYYLCNIAVPEEFLHTVKHVIGHSSWKYPANVPADLNFVYFSGNNPVYVLLDLSEDDIVYLTLMGYYITESRTSMIADSVLEKLHK